MEQKPCFHVKSCDIAKIKTPMKNYIVSNLSAKIRLFFLSAVFSKFYFYNRISHIDQNCVINFWIATILNKKDIGILKSVNKA